MAFPRKLLIPGEEIAVESHPNWSVLVRPALVSLLLVGACMAVAVEWSSAPLRLDYGLLAVGVLVALWFLGKVASYRSRLLVITTRRVVYRWGVLRRTGREIPIDRVQDVTYHQSLFERMVGAGSLTVQSAGRDGDEPFPDVRNPAALQSLINQLMSANGYLSNPLPSRMANPVREPLPDPPTDPFPAVRVDGPQLWQPPPPVKPPTTPPATAPATPPLGDQLRELEHLHEAGVITDAEFAAKRRSVLGL